MSDKQDFSEIGDRIKDAVQDAVNSGDFGQLNHVINDSVNGALDEVRWQVNQAHERVYNGQNRGIQIRQAQYRFFLQHIAVALQTTDGAEAALYDGEAVSAPGRHGRL